MTRPPDADSPPTASRAGTVLRRVAAVLAGLVVGTIAGVAVVLGFAGVRLLLEDIYVHGFGDFLGWPGLPAVIGLLAGGLAAIRLPPRRFWRSLAGVMAGLAAGAAVGAAAGAVVGEGPTAPWLGGLVGAGTGVLLAAAAALIAGRRPPAARFTALLLVVPFIFGRCSEPAPAGARQEPSPAADNVEALVYLVGDPGRMRTRSSPLALRMRRDIEAWSRRLGPGGHVTMVVLGDVIYPTGMHAADSPDREADSLYLAAQIDLVSSPAADSAGARAIFLPGNHDWGQEADLVGVERLERLQAFLDAWSGSAAGRLALRPDLGSGGPAVVDLGPDTRLLVLDTAWWLFDADGPAKDAFIARLRTALQTTDGHRRIMVAHHPLESGGPHGLANDLGRTLGLRFLLRKAGLLLQNLSSRPYADLRARLLAAFDSVGRPDIFAGGHEHSLQVFGSDATAARRDLVIGSGSKLTGVRNAPGMLFGRSEPGYGKIFVLRDGGMHIRIEAAPARYLSCEGTSDVDRCMTDGAEAFRTVWAETLGPRDIDMVAEPLDGDGGSRRK